MKLVEARCRTGAAQLLVDIARKGQGVDALLAKLQQLLGQA